MPATTQLLGRLRLNAVIFVLDNAVDCALRFYGLFEGVFRMSETPSRYLGSETKSWVQRADGSFLVESAFEVESRVAEFLARTSQG